MQDQRTSAGSVPVEFEQGFSSRNSPIASQMYWNNLVSQVDNHNSADHLSFSSGIDMPLANAVDPSHVSFHSWSCDNPGLSEHSIGHTVDDDTEVDQEWASAFTSNSESPLRTNERRFEADGFLSLGNVDVVTDNSEITSRQENDAPQNLVPVTELGISDGQNVGASSSHSFDVRLSDQGQTSPRIASVNTFLTSDVRYMPEENEGRLRNASDSRRVSGKRKNIERIPGQSSLNGNLGCFRQSENLLQEDNTSQDVHVGLIQSNILNISSSSANTSASGELPRSQYSSSTGGNTENNRRNFRMRINSDQLDSPQPNAWPPENSVRRSNHWQPYQPSPPLVPYNQSPEPRIALAGMGFQSQPRIPVIPTLPRHAIPFPLNGPSNSRIGSRSHFPVIVDERSNSLTEEMNPWSVARVSPEPPVFPPSVDAGHAVQDPTSLSFTSGSISALQPAAPPTSQIGPTMVTSSSAPPTLHSRQNLLAQYPQRLSELLRRSFPSATSETGGQRNITQMQRLNLPTSSHDMITYLGTRLRGQQQPRLRSAFLTGREDDGVLGMSSALRIAAVREERSRMLSEIRNALDSIRGGRNLRFEDILVLDHSLFFAGADLHDRHRDMRLDVDNMSYEELLALEERIGNVSTGLSEEMVLKSLKQRKHSLVKLKASAEVEPCCVCQEEYAEGEDIGALDCGHDFHYLCIKQWLAHKNLCPICKKTALIT